MAPKIAVVSSNNKHQQTLFALFQKEGLDGINISEINEKNLDVLYSLTPEVILLDLDLNNTDGIEVCDHLKNEKKIKSYIVLLSGKQEEYIQLEAFKVGADDYLKKSINKRVLVKKVKALLKRADGGQATNPVQTINHKNIVVDKEGYEVYKNKERLYLPKKDFEILVLFLSNPNKVYTREEIYKLIWNNHDSFNARIIDVHVRKIREKIGDYLIETVKGVGYKLAV